MRRMCRLNVAENRAACRYRHSRTLSARPIKVPRSPSFYRRTTRRRGDRHRVRPLRSGRRRSRLRCAPRCALHGLWNRALPRSRRRRGRRSLLLHLRGVGASAGARALRRGAGYALAPGSGAALLRLRFVSAISSNPPLPGGTAPSCCATIRRWTYRCDRRPRGQIGFWMRRGVSNRTCTTQAIG